MKKARLWCCRVSPISSSPCLLKEWICRKKILDNSLSFGKHIGKISKKVGKQQDTFSRLKNILSFSNIVPQSTLCNSFIMSHLNLITVPRYRLRTWSLLDSKKLNRLRKRELSYLYIQRLVFWDRFSCWSYWLEPWDYSLRLRRPNTVLDNCVSFTFFSKTLDPLVTKNGSHQVNNTNVGFLDSLADVRTFAMVTSINVNRPLNLVLFICKKSGR